MARYRVLFVDDEPAILRSLGDYFEKLGHDVYRADTGKAGIAMFERVKPDVTVLDLKLPDISGLEVLSTIRRHHATVLMLTGYGEVETAVEAMRLGAEKNQLRRENVELRARLTPSLKRQIVRWSAVLALLVASVLVGKWIGGDKNVRPTVPIPVPIDSTPR